LTAYLVKESISELLFNLQFVAPRENLTFHKICEVVFACFSRVVKELNGLDADFILVGSCPADRRSHAAKFYRDVDDELKWKSVLDERPFSYDAIGSGEDAFRILFDEWRQSGSRVHFGVFDVLDRILSNGTVPSVGGAVQYGQIEAEAEFKLFGVQDYMRNGDQLEIKQTFRGMELKELYEGKDICDLNIHYGFIDPFHVKKKRIFRELGIPVEDED
jgi:hypothetical protein